MKKCYIVEYKEVINISLVLQICGAYKIRVKINEWDLKTGTYTQYVSDLIEDITVFVRLEIGLKFLGK